jgi:hypothetical protein
MKRNVLYLFILSGILTFCMGCSKEETGLSPANEITISLGRNETYRYDLGLFGDEEGASITTQASHYLVSELNREINSGSISYTYTPALDFTGTDVVVLKSMQGSDGASPNNHVILTTIKFRISN